MLKRNFIGSLQCLRFLMSFLHFLILLSQFWHHSSKVTSLLWWKKNFIEQRWTDYLEAIEEDAILSKSLDEYKARELSSESHASWSFINNFHHLLLFCCSFFHIRFFQDCINFLVHIKWWLENLEATNWYFDVLLIIAYGFMLVLILVLPWHCCQLYVIILPDWCARKRKTTKTLLYHLRFINIFSDFK